MLRENIYQALIAVRANLLRSALTIFIIAFGITAIVGVLTAIDGIQYWLSSSFNALGSNTFKIQNRANQIRIGGGPSAQKRFPSITLDEAIAFKNKMKGQAVVAVSSFGGNVKAHYRNQFTNPNINVRGADENFIGTDGYQVEEGRGITAEDVENGKNVVVVGYEIKAKLFPNTSPVDKYIFVDKHQYRVVGLLKERGSAMGMAGDKVCIIPYSTLLKDFSANNRSFMISVFIDDPLLLKPTAEQSEGIFRLIRQLRPAEDNNFAISMSEEFVAKLMENLRTLTWSATAIAIITLIGAAIGLMNIMLVSVTERTREIGVRKALGASKANIRLQFLVEAITISLMGGAVGVLLGMLMGNVMSLLLGSSFVVPWLWMLISFAVCCIVGLASGYYPANKAASVDPIESLRYE